jgi:hypothetical protein
VVSREKKKRKKEKKEDARHGVIYSFAAVENCWR